MLGSFQRARDLLRGEVAKLRDQALAIEERLREEDGPAVRTQVEETRRRCAEVRAENEELSRRLGRHAAGVSRDSADMARLRAQLQQLRAELDGARGETVQAAQRQAEEQRAADLVETELAQLLSTERALEEMLMVHWEMLEDLAQQINLEPPWKCGLCSCSNQQEDSSCSVCESPKDGKTDLGNRSVEAYFEFRLHQEFLGRSPPPEPERALAALKIALGHSEEKWIEREEIEELHEKLRALATDLAADPVLRAEAAFALFALGGEDGRRTGRMLLKTMGEKSDAVRRMCRRQRQQRVAVLYQRLLLLKQHDTRRFDEWCEKLGSAQARFRRHSLLSSK